MKSLSAIENYHAHVYYDEASKPAAVALRREMEIEFPGADFGRWHDRPVGPHPDWSFQIAFKADLFQPIVSWLALNRGRLVVFVHPQTGDPLADHSDHAIWMGAVRPLDLGTLNS
ncbi:MAG TPA: DOPA 4,5-dioxygenase family protein [Afifellaceae bacterium]|nr:DOPA 4,5-dioxygenase family protein [Afifellaceae bacterium]